MKLPHNYDLTTKLLGIDDLMFVSMNYRYIMITNFAKLFQKAFEINQLVE